MRWWWLGLGLLSGACEPDVALRQVDAPDGGPAVQRPGGAANPAATFSDAPELAATPSPDWMIQAPPRCAAPLVEVVWEREGVPVPQVTRLIVEADRISFALSSGPILSVSKRGGPPTEVSAWAPETPADMLRDLDGRFVVLAGSGMGGTLYRLEGGAPATLASDRLEPFMLGVGPRALYWTTSAGSLMAYDRANGSAAPIYRGLPPLRGLAIDEGHAYVAQPRQGTLLAIPLEGGAPTVLAAGQAAPYRVVSDERSVYFTDHALPGALMRVGKDGNGLVRLAEEPSGPLSLALDSTHLYWSTDSGSIKRVPIGGGPVERLAEQAFGNFQAVSFELALDETHVYWMFQINRLSLRRIAKHCTESGSG